MSFLEWQTALGFLIVNISKVAIVGAGVSGLVCSSLLAEKGLQVTVFDKGRFLGGRLASRDRDENTFDYGAQYFTVRDLRFRQFVDRLVHCQKAARWNGRFAKMTGGVLIDKSLSEPRYVGVPLMRSIADLQASTIDCLTSHRVTGLTRQKGKWLLTGSVQDQLGQTTFSRGEYDFIVLGLPPLQAAALYPHTQLSSITFRPCVALLLSFSERVNIDFDGVALDDEVISWVARDSSKPGRPQGERWVIHASPHWSEQNFESDKDEIERLLIQRYATIFDISIPEIRFAKLHKWRYALPITPQALGCIFNSDSALAYCGDWCVGARVEGAFLSGLSVAEEIIRAATL